MKEYTLYVDSYGTDSFGSACVKTNKITVSAASDRGIKQIARNRRDVSKIVRDDGTILMSNSGEYPYSTSNYAVGC